MIDHAADEGRAVGALVRLERIAAALALVGGEGVGMLEGRLEERLEGAGAGRDAADGRRGGAALGAAVRHGAIRRGRWRRRRC